MCQGYQDATIPVCPRPRAGRVNTYENSVSENLMTPREHLKASAGSDDEIIQPRLGLGLGLAPTPRAPRAAYTLMVQNSH